MLWCSNRTTHHTLNDANTSLFVNGSHDEVSYSLHVFLQMMESVDAQRKAVEGEGEPIPALAMLANDTSALATKEVEKFSPVLKKWHLCAGGIAAVTLHACYRREIKQYVSRLDALTPDAQQVLQAADLLEKSLVQIAVEEGADAEDGGKALIREMPPFETDKIVGDLAKKWVQQRLKKLGDWVSRNVEQEVTPSVCTHNFFLSLAIVWFMMERIVFCNTGNFLSVGYGMVAKVCHSSIATFN